MKVEAIYHPRVMTVQPDDRLEVAAGAVVGMISLRDLVDTVLRAA